MASQVEICNMALLQLGAARINSISDNSDEARLCSAFYNQTVDLVSVDGKWPTTITRQDLSQTDNTPEFDFTYEYQLPTVPFCLSVVSIDGDVEYVIEGDKLLTDESTASIKYIARLTNPQAYGPHLTQAIVNKLTATLAYPISAQVGVQDRWVNYYDSQLPRLLASAMLQNSLQNYECSTLTYDIR